MPNIALQKQNRIDNVRMCESLNGFQFLFFVVFRNVYKYTNYFEELRYNDEKIFRHNFTHTCGIY